MGIYLVMLFKVYLFVCGTEHECLAHGYARAYFNVPCRMLHGHNVEISGSCQLGSKFGLRYY